MKKKTRMLKIVSMVLILSMVIGMIPSEVIAQNAAAQDKTTVSEEQTLENREIKEEVVSERTESTKTFLRKDGTKTVVASPEQLHYYDKKDDEWIEIDNTLEKNSDNKETISNKQNELQVEFPKKLDNDIPVVVTNKKHSISFKLQNEILASTAEINNDVVDIAKDADETEKRMNMEDKYSQIDYADVLKDTSLVYMMSSHLL